MTYGSRRFATRMIREVSRTALPAAVGVLLLLSPAASAGNGWLLKLRHAEAPPGQAAEIWLDGDMIRATEPGLAQEVILGDEAMTVLDHREKNYFVISYAQIEAFLVPMMSMMQQSAQAQRDKLRASLGDLSPEERARVEKELEALEARSAGGFDPDFEIRETGETGTVAGLTARKLEVVEGGTITGEIWTSNRIPMQGIQGLVERFEPLLPQMPMGTSRYWSATGLLDGFPVKIVDMSGGEPTLVMEVVEAKPRTFSAADWKPPSGYERSSLNLDTLLGK